MKRLTETVLYYTPENNINVTKLKGVLVRMGIRIKNVAPEQVKDSVGSLLGFAEYEKNDGQGGLKEEWEEGDFPRITEEMLVMHNFSSRRLDELLLNLRKAGVPKIDLKAVVTESNVAWTFYQLYEEIKEEHEKMEENSR
ncbi:DUF3783 domain-containing protein [Clostridium sp. AN503]|uniref:DUF3783 domain-containing protein n=1 Tax=Clostridium sp. AN503 TaxID=3160598 RepID=UPI003459271E